jgi:hypothetical protein
MLNCQSAQRNGKLGSKRFGNTYLFEDQRPFQEVHEPMVSLSVPGPKPNARNTGQDASIRAASKPSSAHLAGPGTARISGGGISDS